MRLRRARDEELRARDALAHSAWGDRLSVDSFCEREEILRGSAWSRACLRTWLLEESGGKIVASCETYRMESRVANERGSTFGIASVFVERDLRGHGFATEMIRQVLERLRAEGAQASILYSEVGAALYERTGFVARPAATRFWSAARASSGPAVQRLARGDIPALLVADERRPLRFRVAATPAQIDWHFARARFYEDRLDRPPLPNAALRSGSAWAILCPDHRHDRVVLLDLEPGSAADTEAVVEAARDAALRAGLAEVTIQESPYHAAVLPPGGRRDGDDGIPMIRPLHPDLSPEDWRDYTRATWM